MCKLRLKYLVNSKGFSLTELMFSMGLLVIVFYAVFNLLSRAQMSFFTSDSNIDLRNSLRQSADKIALELRNTGYVGATPQFTISNNTGYNNSDVLRFSIPVLCSSTSTLLSASGTPNYWGAPLTWGCNSYTCMDQDGVCATVEYKYIEYSLSSAKKLQRKVLNAALAVVASSTTTVGNDVSDFQVTQSADTHIITFVITGSKKAPSGRTVTATYSEDVLLNNRGG